MGRPSFAFGARPKSLHGEKDDEMSAPSASDLDRSMTFHPLRFSTDATEGQAVGSSTRNSSTSLSLSRRSSSSNYGDEGRAALYDYVSRRSLELEALNRKLASSNSSGTPEYAIRVREDPVVARYRSHTDIQFQSCRDLGLFMTEDAPIEIAPGPLPWAQVDSREEASPGLF